MPPATKLWKSAPVWFHDPPSSTMSLQERPTRGSEQPPRSTLRSSSANPRLSNTLNRSDSLERDMATPGDRTSLPLLPRTSAQTEGRLRSNSVEQLQQITMGFLSALGSRPSTANSEDDFHGNRPSRLSVFGGGLFSRSRNASQEVDQAPGTPHAWLLCAGKSDHFLTYSLDNLITGNIVSKEYYSNLAGFRSNFLVDRRVAPSRFRGIRSLLSTDQPTRPVNKNSLRCTISFQTVLYNDP